jgi:anti-repressor protein
VFTNHEFGQIRTFTGNDGEPWFVGKDVANALGYTNPQKAIRDHVDEEDRTVNESFTVNGTAVTLVNESGIYALILTSKLPKAKEFKHWITSDVLPAIRRDGGYMVARDGETPQETMARALLIAQETIDRKDSTIAAQQDTIRELAPKAAFYDAVGDSDGKMSVADFSKALRQAGIHMGQNRLFTWFRENGYMGKRGVHRNRPTQKTIEQALFYLHDNTFVDNDGKVFTSFTPMITPKGATFFFKRITRQRQMKLPA